MNRRHDTRFCAGLLAAIGALVPALAAAQSLRSEPAQGPWRYGVSLYAYLPSLDGTSSVPADPNGTPISISAEQLGDLKFTVMGTFEAHNGEWGVFTDVVYLEFGGNHQRTREFTIDDALPPAGTTADLDLNLEGSLWTLAGAYRVVAEPGTTIDVLAGLRRFDVRTRSTWSITGDLGPIQPSGRTGSSENKVTAVDALVGIRGRTALGTSGRWSLPFYLDVGAGESDLTWQAATGISYAFQWGQLSVLWRYLAYEMKAGDSLTGMQFNGPLIGATWRW